jgi:hypothetical protein
MEKQKFLTVLLFATILSTSVATEVEVTTAAALQKSLGDGVTVAEIKNGEVSFTAPSFPRIEISDNGTVSLTLRNPTGVSIGPVLKCTLYDNCGIDLAELDASFQADPVPAGGMATRSFKVSEPLYLEKVLTASTISLPAGWKLPRFVAVSISPPETGPHKPHARPPLSIRVRPAVGGGNTFGMKNTGISGRDARWSNYGDYMQKLEETVQIAWDDILNAERKRPPSGSTVQITFILASDGSIKTIKQVRSSPGTTEFGSRACLAGITNPAPFGKWTDDMVTVLGREQEMTFTFYYQ